MTNKLIDFILKNVFWILFITLGIFFWGIWGLKDIAIDAVPDVTNVQVQINVKTKALDPESIEAQITRKLEIEVSGISRLIDMRSISKFGLAQVTLIFKEGTDLYWARQQVSEKLNSVELPPEMKAELAPISTGLGEVYMYTLEIAPHSELSSLTEIEKLTTLRGLQDTLLKTELKKVDGVAEIDSNGGYVKQIHINFFPEKLEQYGLSISQLKEKIQSLGVSAGGGYIQYKNEQIIVRTNPILSDLKTISQLSLGIANSGKPLALKDVAEVRIDHSLRVGAATVDGKQAVLGTVLMRVGANGRNVVKGIEEALQNLKLPEGIKVVPLYTRKFLVDNTIHTVSVSLIEGAILVILVLLVLLGNLKAALIVTLAIPLSMLVAIQGMNFFGITGNLMSLGAIDFGLLVDGSVVMVETYLAKLALEKKSLSFIERSQLLKKSFSEIVSPVSAGIILIMAVYLPILTLEGVEGKMFRPMALTVLMALGTSLIVAIFLMPVLSLQFLKPETSHQNDHDTWFFKKIKSLFIPLLEKTLTKPLPFFSGAAAFTLIAIILFKNLGSDFVPQLDEGDLVIGITRSTKIGIDASVNEQIESEKVLKQFPEIKQVFARLGTPESATDPMGVNLADTFLILEKNRKIWRYSSKEELTQAILNTLKERFPHNDFSSTQPIEMRFNEMLEGSRADISLKIFGDDLQKLFDYGLRAQEIFAPLKGVESIEQDPLTALRRGPVLDITPDFTQLALFGITLQDLNQTVELSLAGEQIGLYVENSVRYPIILHLDESLRDNPDFIKTLPLDLPQGGTIPLSQVSRLSMSERITTIARQWGKRYAAISVNVSGRDLSSLVAEAKEKMMSSLNLEKNYSLVWAGQFKNMERAHRRLLIIVPLTLLIVFIILLRVFSHIVPTLLIFSSIPFAGVGGIFALYFRDLNFSVSAGVGFIALIGIALLNSIVLMTFLLKECQIHSPEKAVRIATLSRLRPVLMTALVAGLGFIPMAVNSGLGAEVQRPLATVVIGGLMTSTFLTLFLLPAAFLIWKQRTPQNTLIQS
jgi:cobalt-zinc-cadmium resistance protein CzcA